MDVVAAVCIVDQLGGGGVILIGAHAVKSAAGVVLEGLRHLGGGLLHERDLGVVGVFRVVGAIAPRVEDGLDAGVQRDEGVYVVRVQKPLQRLDLRLGGGGGAGGGPVHIADLLAVLRLDVIPVPLVIEGAVHVDPAGAWIVAEHAVFIPVRALHAEDGEVPRRRVVRLAAIERGDEAVAVDVRWEEPHIPVDLPGDAGAVGDRQVPQLPPAQRQHVCHLDAGVADAGGKDRRDAAPQGPGEHLPGAELRHGHG